VPDTVGVILTELAGETRDGLLALAVGPGLQVIAALMETRPPTRRTPGLHQVQLRTGVRAFTADGHPRAVWITVQRLRREQPGDLGEPGAVTVSAVRVDRVRPYLFRDQLDGVAFRSVIAQPTENSQATPCSRWERMWARNALVHPAVSARIRISWSYRWASGICANAWSRTWMWSAAVFAPALLRRSVPASRHGVPRALSTNEMPVARGRREHRPRRRDRSQRGVVESVEQPPACRVRRHRPE
jgi:hypothetical protein